MAIMFRLTLALAFLALVALASTADDHRSQAEWTGKPWLGKWEQVREENWQAYLDAVGGHGPYGDVSSKVILELWKDRDHFHQALTYPDHTHYEDLKFKLGEEFNIDNNGTVLFRVTFTEDGKRLINHVKIVFNNIQYQGSVEVTGEKLLKTYKAGDVIAKRWFKRLANPTPAPPAAAA